MILTHQNVRIYYTCTGQGPSLVLLHGFLESTAIWAPFVETLALENKVVCIDLLGHGKSDSVADTHSMSAMAKAVKAVLDHLTITHCRIAGHSMGGYVALAFAKHYPDTIRGLLLINATASADNAERKTNRIRAIEAVKQDYNKFVRIGIASLFNPTHKGLHENAIEALTKNALKTPVQGVIAALKGMKARGDSKSVLRQFKHKKAMIIGENDPVLDYKSLCDEAEKTGAESIIFPDGHMSFIENKIRFLKSICHFSKVTHTQIGS